MDLEEKIIKAKKGDDNAFYELISERKDILYKTAFTYVKNKEDALDILNETVYRAFISIRKLKEPRFFNTWITRILINCALDTIRKDKKVLQLHEQKGLVSLSNTLPQEEVFDLYTAVDGLKERYKTIVILKYFQDMTFAEIAEVLQCPLGTVKTNLYKALQELRINLEEVELDG
ncbi:MAG: sigma-70 family RNA polymerase sigma factor [Clostridiaceae bacterium]|nr:sigma-70 family RNA polymerase sigma factor [Clostridiaceae bacterium]